MPVIAGERTCLALVAPCVLHREKYDATDCSNEHWAQSAHRLQRRQLHQRHERAHEALVRLLHHAAAAAPQVLAERPQALQVWTRHGRLNQALAQEPVPHVRKGLPAQGLALAQALRRTPQLPQIRLKADGRPPPGRNVPLLLRGACCTRHLMMEREGTRPRGSLGCTLF